MIHSVIFYRVGRVALAHLTQFQRQYKFCRNIINQLLSFSCYLFSLSILVLHHRSTDKTHAFHLLAYPNDYLKLHQTRLDISLIALECVCVRQARLFVRIV